MEKLQVMDNCSSHFFPHPSFLLGACGDEDSRASDAANWLTSYYRTNPPNLERVVINITIDDKERVVVDVLVPNEGQVGLIKSRARVEQAHIVRMACPSNAAEVWVILSGNRVLWVNLLEETAGGLYKQITGSSCKR